MKRQEENRITIEFMTKAMEAKPKGTYEEIVTFQLGVIATMLTDISKSLAIITDKVDKVEREDKE